MWFVRIIVAKAALFFQFDSKLLLLIILVTYCVITHYRYDPDEVVNNAWNCERIVGIINEPSVTNYPWCPGTERRDRNVLTTCNLLLKVLICSNYELRWNCLMNTFHSFRTSLSVTAIYMFRLNGAGFIDCAAKMTADGASARSIMDLYGYIEYMWFYIAFVDRIFVRLSESKVDFTGNRRT